MLSGNQNAAFLINYILPALGALSKLSEVNVEKEVLFVSLILLLIGYLISHVNKNIDDYRCFLALPLFPIYQATLTATFGMSIALYFLKIDIPWHKLNRNTLKDRA